MLRAALYGHAFNPARASTDPVPPAAVALGWARHHSMPLTALADPAVTRQALSDGAANSLRRASHDKRWSGAHGCLHG
jgi:hypothetical protein